jgi:hypothetical protein
MAYMRREIENLASILHIPSICFTNAQFEPHQNSVSRLNPFVVRNTGRERGRWIEVSFKEGFDRHQAGMKYSNAVQCIAI